MIHNFIFRDINAALPHLLGRVGGAPEVGSRAGKTRELRHVGITLTDPLSREILVPGRRANLAAQIAETVWVLAGRNDIDWLSNYLPRARDFSDDGETWRSGYGDRIRHWGYSGTTDQLANIVAMLRKDPETRQAVISLWEPYSDATVETKDRPCNNWLHFSARDGALDLHVAIRSNDLMWGWSGINAFEWSVLLEVVAGLTGLRVGSLHFSTTSLHLYERHWERAAKIVEEAATCERVTAEPSPRFNPLSDELGDLDDLLERWFQIEYDVRTGSPLVRGYIDYFPEPMLRSWLQVLDWWWNGKFHGDLRDDALGVAAKTGVQPTWMESRKVSLTTVSPEPGVSPFLQHAIKTHNEKHAAYGDSWKRRGEMLGIMANEARKVDRLGGSTTSDETSADTAMDLMIYLAKHRVWLDDQKLGSNLSDTTDVANQLLINAEKLVDAGWEAPDDPETWLRFNFDLLEKKVLSGDPERASMVESMLRVAYVLARHRWDAEREVEQDYVYRGADHD